MKKDRNLQLDNIAEIYGNYKELHDRLAAAVDEIAEKKSESTNEYSSGATQWSIQGRSFIPTRKTTVTLPAGWYKFTYLNSMVVPELMDIRNDELVNLPMPEYTGVLDDMGRFWGSEENYRKYNFPYKRGILLYGRPGTGKSGLIRLIADKLIKDDGVLFNIGSPDDIFAFESVFSVFREIEPERKAICVLEDVDNFVRYGGSTQAKLLNVLDGNMKYDNIVFIASTNFPEILIESLANRPSRFDRRYEIGTPTKEARRVYIVTKFKELKPEEVDKLVNATEGFTIDLLKECVLSVYALGYRLEDIVNLLKNNFVYNGKVGYNVNKFKDSNEIVNENMVSFLRDSIDKELIR